MASDGHILLMGLRASGKSTLGPLLAERLALPFLDLDARTLALLECATASEAFRTLGEPAFRAAEARALREALTPPARVIALGGGTPTAPGVADLLREARGAGRALIIYLHAAPAVLRDRLRGTDMANRPGLLGPDPLAEIEAIYAARDPLYRALADHVVEVDEDEAARLADALGVICRR